MRSVNDRRLQFRTILLGDRIIWLNFDHNKSDVIAAIAALMVYFLLESVDEDLVTSQGCSDLHLTRYGVWYGATPDIVYEVMIGQW